MKKEKIRFNFNYKNTQAEQEPKIVFLAQI